MKTQILIILFLGLFSCQPFSRKADDVSATLLVNDLKYSAYSWYFPAGQWEFHLEQYLHIDQSGRFQLMIRDSSTSKPAYFTGALSESLVKLINETFVVDTFKTDYKTNALDGIAYSGFTYCLDLKKDKSRKNITFIRTRIPANLDKLCTKLDRFANVQDIIRVDTIDFEGYVEELKKFSSDALGPVPRVEMIPFEVPKIQK